MDAQVFIFVLDRGFVVIGEAKPNPDKPFWWHMERSATIRVWGTQNGLSQLKDGPLESTVLDPVAERHTPDRSIIDIIVPSVEGAKKWRAKLRG